MEHNNEIIDPAVKFPTEVFEEILHHLSVKELMNCTVVCSNWNEIIGSSLRIMSKVKLTTKSIYGNTNLDINLIKDSTRKYQNIEISIDLEDFNVLFEFLKKRKMWKFIVFTCLAKLDKISNFLKLIETFEATIEYLEIDDIQFEQIDETIKTIEEKMKKFKFKKLKCLLIEHRFIYIVVTIFISCFNLEKIKFNTWIYKMSNYETVVKILKQQKNLKELRIDNRFIHGLFTKDFKPDFPFQLEKFYVQKGYEHKSSHSASFIQFLKLQPNIKDIMIGETSWVDPKVLNVILSLPLEKINFSYLPNESCEGVVLKPNNSVEHVHFQICNEKFHYVQFELNIAVDESQHASIPNELWNIFKTILKCFPNLKKLHLLIVNKDLALFLAENFKKLERVETVFLLDKCACMEILPCLVLPFYLTEEGIRRSKLKNA